MFRFLAPILAFLIGSSAAGADPLSFKGAVDGMKARNESLMAAQDDVHQREAERAGARGLKLPKVELEVRHYTLNDSIKITADIVDLGFIPGAIQVQKNNFWKGEATVTVPLYTGGRIDAANHAAEAREKEAGAQYCTTEDQLVTELAQRYYGLCLARRARDVQKLKVDAMEQHAFRARRLMEEGMVAKVEYLNANVALANAKQEFDAAERDVAIVSEGLSNIVVSTGAMDPASPLFLVSDLEPRDRFQDYVDDETHPILKMLAAKNDLAHQGVRVEEGAEKPTVYLFGMHELVPEDLTVLDPRWAAGVGMQYTLFDGFQGRHKIEAAKAVEQKVAHMRQKVRRDLKSLVVKRYEELEKARSQFEAFDTTLDLTQENLRVRTRAFEEGLATSVEVVDAMLSHARAQLGRFKAAYDFDLALFQLIEASGRTSHYEDYLARAIPVAERDPASSGQNPPATEQPK